MPVIEEKYNSTTNDLYLAVLKSFGGTEADIEPVYNNTTNDILNAIFKKTSGGVQEEALQTEDGQNITTEDDQNILIG
jgi:hypothetical protein